MKSAGIDYEGLNLPVLLRLARATYGEAIRAALGAAGYGDLPPSGLHLLASLDLSGAAMPLAQLIARLGTSKQVAGQAVDTMVLRGYVHRAPDSADRRRLVVGLTPRGIAAAHVQRGVRQRIDRALAAEVGEEAVRQARRTLASLIELGRASAAVEEAAPALAATG